MLKEAATIIFKNILEKLKSHTQFLYSEMTLPTLPVAVPGAFLFALKKMLSMFFLVAMAPT